MLPVAKRLSRQDFVTLRKRGKALHSSFFTLVHVPQTESRGAVVVAKKVALEAVTRNRLKRQLRALLPACFAASAGLYLLVAKPAAKARTFSELEASLTELLQKIGSK